MPTQTLKIFPSYGADIERTFDVIPRSFGDGYDNSVVVGNSTGLIFYRLRFDYLHYSTDQLSVLDPEDSVTKNWPRYLWDFFARRIIDGEAFNIKYDTDVYNLVNDTTTGTALLVKFVDTRISYNQFTFKLYSTGLTLRQWRAAS